MLILYLSGNKDKMKFFPKLMQTYFITTEEVLPQIHKGLQMNWLLHVLKEKYEIQKGYLII